MTDDDDDLMGDITPAAPPRPRVGRPTKEQVAARLAAAAALNGTGKIELPDTGMFYRPVGVKFLADVFRMEQRTVLKKLMKCPVAEFADHLGRKVPRWDFKVASGYLVEPRIDIAQWIASQRIADLPTHISDQYYKAMLSKQRWEANAKHTWRDEDVQAVFGEAAMLIRDTSLLWVEELPDKASISSENYHALRGEVTDLLNQIKTIMLDAPKRRRTLSTLTELDAEIEQQDNDALSDFDGEAAE